MAPAERWTGSIQPMSTAAIIDCDPGHDDVMAILLAAAHAGPARHHDRARQHVAREHDAERPQATAEFAELTHIPIAARMPRPLVREATLRNCRFTVSPGSMARDFPRPPCRSSTSTRSTSSSIDPDDVPTCTSCRSGR